MSRTSLRHDLFEGVTLFSKCCLNTISTHVFHPLCTVFKVLCKAIIPHNDIKGSPTSISLYYQTNFGYGMTQVTQAAEALFVSFPTHLFILDLLSHLIIRESSEVFTLFTKQRRVRSREDSKSADGESYLSCMTISSHPRSNTKSSSIVAYMKSSRSLSESPVSQNFRHEYSRHSLNVAENIPPLSPPPRRTPSQDCMYMPIRTSLPPSSSPQLQASLSLSVNLS
jgi:hypothetical protein